MTSIVPHVRVPRWLLWLIVAITGVQVVGGVMQLVTQSAPASNVLVLQVMAAAGAILVVCVLQLRRARKVVHDGGQGHRHVTRHGPQA